MFKFNKFFKFIFTVILVFSFINYFALSKSRINVCSYITNLEVSNIIYDHINRYSQSKVLSLFEVKYINVDKITDLNTVLNNDEIDILIAPVQLIKVIERYKKINTWDNYFTRSPTIFAVFKTYTFDFMKSLIFGDKEIKFLPFFAYSFYYDQMFPSFENLSIIEILSVNNAITNTLDYVEFYNSYLKNLRVRSYLYSLIGDVVYPGAKIFSLKDNFIQMDPGLVLYGIFVTSSSMDSNRERAVYFLATKIWDFETQIDLCLKLGVLGSDKNTTLHPGFVQKIKDKSFSLHYNNQLGKLKDYRIDYDLFDRVYDIVLQSDRSGIVSYLNQYLYSPLLSLEFLYSNYYNLITKNKAKDYLLLVWDKNNKKVEKLLYTPNFNSKKIKILKKGGKEKSKIYESKTIYDIAVMMLSGDEISEIESYKLKYKKNNSLLFELKNRNFVMIKRETPSYLIIAIWE